MSAAERYLVELDRALEREHHKHARKLKRRLAMVEWAPEEWELKRPIQTPITSAMVVRLLEQNRSPAARLHLVQELVEHGLISNT